jgi:heme exporter protein B
VSRAFLAILRRDLALAVRAGGGGELALVFFLTVVVLIPFALGPDLNLLSRIGPAILWLGALLATLIGLDRLFQADEEDGSLDLIRGAPLPLELAVFAKALAHWLTTGLPLTLAAPLLGLLVALPADGVLPLTASLALGTPALSFIGAAAAALTASLRRGGLILPILVAPLCVPVLIFGVSASDSARGPMPLQSPLLILAALSLIAATVGCIAAAAALRQPD